MTRISTADAIRLGLISRPLPKNESAEKNSKPRKPSPLKGRRSAKGGRIAVSDAPPPFSLSFFIPLAPKTKERPRTSLSKKAIQRAFYQASGSAERFAGLLENIKHHTYTPDDTGVFETAVSTLAMAHMRGDRTPYQHPLHIDLAFCLEGDGSSWPTDVTDPDIDNMEKAIYDALNKIVWKDDRLLVSKRAIKICAPKAGIAVSIQDIGSMKAQIDTLRALIPGQGAGF